MCEALAVRSTKGQPADDGRHTCPAWAPGPIVALSEKRMIIGITETEPILGSTKPVFRIYPPVAYKTLQTCGL